MRKTFFVLFVFLLIILASCAPKQQAYSSELEKRIQREESGQTQKSVRPDYLPSEMFKNLPKMPDDFYQKRSLVQSNIITDITNISEAYWLQPEWFPKFESNAVPVLANPPKDRWGAYGIAVYPPESVSGVKPGESLDMVFWLTSGYLVETYQGFKLEGIFPVSSSTSASAMLSGATSIHQDPETVKKYFNIEVTPNVFVLNPNFPIFSKDGTKRIKVRITAAKDTPPGDYLVAVDTVPPSADQETTWIKQYLNRYASGKYVKLDRPYYQAFISVSE